MIAAALAAVAAGTATLLAFAPRSVLVVVPPARSTPMPGAGRSHLVLCVLAGLCAGLFLGGTPGLVAAPLAAGAAWVALARSEPGAVRRERQALARELPHVVDLLSCALRAGASPPAALSSVIAACPGPTTHRLEGVLARLHMGVDPASAWGALAHDDVLAPLGRTLSRAERSGASVAGEIERLADDLERAALAAVEDRARAVGVKAAVPLGLCLLPAFLLIGIVPTVAALLTSLTP